MLTDNINTVIAKLERAEELGRWLKIYTKF